MVTIKETLLKEGDVAELKTLKNYVLMKGEVYCRMPRAILSRCVGHEEGQKKLKEVYNKTCGSCGKIKLYHRLQRADFYWPNLGKDADLIQTQCEAYHLVVDREESYAMFAIENWRSPFIHYLTEGALP